MRYADFVDEIRGECYEAPIAAIERVIGQSAVDFCKQSRIWREKRTLEVESGTDQLRLRTSAGGRVDQVLQAVHLDTKGRTVELGKIEDHKIINAPSGQPKYFSEGLERSNPVIRFWPVPDRVGQVELYVVLVPQRSSTAIPDHISEEWYEAIVHGALYRLMIQSDKPWANAEKALFHKQQFDLAVRDAKQKAVSDGWAPKTIELRKWA